MHCLQFSSHDGGVHAIIGCDFGSPTRLSERLRVQGPSRWNTQISALLRTRSPKLPPLIREPAGGKINAGNLVKYIEGSRRIESLRTNTSPNPTAHAQPHQLTWTKKMSRLLRQLCLINPFKGDVPVSRVWITRPSSRGRTLPFPTAKNYRQPIEILATFFAKAYRQKGYARHNRYVEIPGFDPVLVTRDPRVIRAILTSTGVGEGRVDRDTMPSEGIARATGPDTLLFANGQQWKTHRNASAKAFGKTSLFNDDVFCDFEQTFREHLGKRLADLRQYFERTERARLKSHWNPKSNAS